MTRDELRAKISTSTYFCDTEGKLLIREVNKDTFLAEDTDGEIYELFYVDYIFNRQQFEVLK